MSGGKSIKVVSLITHPERPLRLRPPLFFAILQVSHSQNIAGIPSAAAVPKYCIFKLIPPIFVTFL